MCIYITSRIVRTRSVTMTTARLYGKIVGMIVDTVNEFVNVPKEFVDELREDAVRIVERVLAYHRNCTEREIFVHGRVQDGDTLIQQMVDTRYTLGLKYRDERDVANSICNSVMHCAEDDAYCLGVVQWHTSPFHEKIRSTIYTAIRGIIHEYEIAMENIPIDVKYTVTVCMT
uniref:Uncharacterized protein n=1 Tax=viral metagenome TaxID=1070528 RepID=A0A6C0M076_9ZZZZ